MTLREKITFIGMALFVWFFYRYAQKLFISGIGGRSQYLIMLQALPFVLVLLLVYIVISQRKLVSVGAIILLGIYALFLSLRQTHFVQMSHLHNFFTAIRERQSIKDIITPLAIIIDSEGIDMFFHFFLATISRYVAYSFREKFSLREFKNLWIVWFLIILVGEIVIQGRTIQRFVSPFDILNNMIGVTVALFLCLKKRKERRLNS